MRRRGRDDPRIRLATRRAEDMAEFAVTDDGPGFPPEMMGRVFEPYVTTKVGGTGLGLAIVKKIRLTNTTDRSDNNRPPSGAEVSILLPLAPESAIQSNIAEISRES